jgi:hypothetical protein
MTPNHLKPDSHWSQIPQILFASHATRGFGPYTMTAAVSMGCDGEAMNHGFKRAADGARPLCSPFDNFRPISYAC